MKRRVLIAVHLDSFFSYLFDIARMLAGSDDYEPIVLFARPYRGIPRDAQRCRDAGIRCLGADAAAINGKPVRGFVRKLAPWAMAPADAVRKRVLDSVPMQLADLRRRQLAIERLLEGEHISLLVLGGDIVHYDTAVYVKAAAARHVPSVIVAGWMAQKTENAKAFRAEPSMQLDRLSNLVVGTLFPEWVLEQDGKALIRLPAGQVVARRLLGLAPPSPWTLHSGHADAIALPSEAELELCVAEGLPPRQLRLTGAISHDVMWRARQDANALRRELGFADPDRPLLLSALPPNELARTGGRPECEFADYPALVDAWIAALRRARGWNLLVSLHPSALREDHAHLEGDGVRLARRPTAELMPLCDVFVAAQSATIAWAAACGRPIIDYDVYRYRHIEYAGIRGLVAVSDRDTFAAAIERIASDAAYREELRGAQAADAEHWGRIDGRAGERLTALFGELMELP